MRFKKIAVRYVILLWSAVVFIAYYTTFIYIFFVEEGARTNPMRVFDFIRGFF
ncbi:hypothetical protein ACFL6S_23780 [Candidatus Poribacteria bacterium]